MTERITVEYGRTSPAHGRRRLLWQAGLVLLALALPIGFYIGATKYTARKWDHLRRGMTRVQVDRQLWAFRSYPFPQYSGLGTGQSAVRYELLWLGKATMIQIIYDPDGTAFDVQPIFNN